MFRVVFLRLELDHVIVQRKRRNYTAKNLLVCEYRGKIFDLCGARHEEPTRAQTTAPIPPSFEGTLVDLTLGAFA